MSLIRTFGSAFMSGLSRNAHQTGRPPTILNLRRPSSSGLALRRAIRSLGQDQKPGASGVQPGAGSVLKQRRHWRMRRFEVPEDNGFILECVRLWDCGLDTKDIMLIVFQPEHIVETATILGRERRRR